MLNITAPGKTHKRWGGLLLTIALCTTALYLLQPDQALDGDSLLFSQVERGSLPQKVQGFGKFVALDNQLLTAPFHGTVSQLHYRTGDIVEKGAVIIEMVNYDVQRLLQEAQMDYAQAKLTTERTMLDWQQRIQQQHGRIREYAANLSLQELENTARQHLFEQAIISTLEIERSRLQLSQAKDVHQRALEELERLQLQKKQALLLEENSVHLALQRLTSRQLDADRLQITAPLAGKLDNLQVSIGQSILPGDTFAAIKGESDFALRVRIPQRSAGQLHAGQTAEFNLGDPYTATVRTIFPGVRQGFIEIELSLPETIQDAKEDLELPVAIITGRYDDAWYVQKPLGIIHGSKIPLFVKEGQVLKRMEVLVQDILDNHLILAPHALAQHTKVLISDSAAFQTKSHVTLKE